MTKNARDKSLSLRRDLADTIPVLKQESYYAIYEAYSVVQVLSNLHTEQILLISTKKTQTIYPARAERARAVTVSQCPHSEVR